MKRFLFIGHSHVRAIEAAAARSPRWADAHFLDLNRDEFKPAARIIDGRIVLNRALSDAIDRIVKGEECFFALAVGGAMHNVLGLVHHPVKFQFMNPWKQVDPVPEVPMLPFEAVRGVLEESLSYQLLVLRALARHVDGPLVQLQSPPPVPSKEALLATPGVYGQAIRQFGVLDEKSRFAWWRIQSDAFEAAAEEEGMGFLPAPSQCVDPEGFLIKEAWRDPTHGNVWYGEQVLSQVYGEAENVPSL